MRLMLLVATFAFVNVFAGATYAGQSGESSLENDSNVTVIVWASDDTRPGGGYFYFVPPGRDTPKNRGDIVDFVQINGTWHKVNGEVVVGADKIPRKRVLVNGFGTPGALVSPYYALLSFGWPFGANTGLWEPSYTSQQFMQFPSVDNVRFPLLPAGSGGGPSTQN